MSRRARRAPSHPLRRGLLPEDRRITLSLLLAFVLSFIPIQLVPALQWADGTQERRLAAVAILFALMLSLYSALHSALTHHVLRRLPREQLVVLMRLSRARTASPWHRWVRGSATATGGALQLVVLAGIVLFLLIRRPAGIPLGFLLGLAVFCMLTAWVGTVVSFAGEYAAIDGRGEAFDVPGAPAHERIYEEYLHIATLVQTSAAPSDAMPLTRTARRTMRGQSVLSYVMNSVVIAVGTSVVITALGGG